MASRHSPIQLENAWVTLLTFDCPTSSDMCLLVQSSPVQHSRRIRRPVYHWTALQLKEQHQAEANPAVHLPKKWSPGQHRVRPRSICHHKRCVAQPPNPRPTLIQTSYAGHKSSCTLTTLSHTCRYSFQHDPATMAAVLSFVS